ncbi:CAP family protein [Streptomyces sp. NPDC015171]|uniref:CAP family protein n=1 Tax=Streptomyces sp. NPDC015171 TaxID=3364945 RepID=UPI0037021541
MKRYPKWKSVLGAAGLAAAVMLTASAPSAWADPQPDITDDAFLKDCQDTVNAYRARHGAPPLTFDETLIEYAQERAQEVSAAGKPTHDGLDPRYGENLDRGSTGHSDESAPYKPRTCKQAVDGWYNEARKYDFDNPGPQNKADNFTQLVWASTTKIGCARAGGEKPDDGSGWYWYETYIVCNFETPGNQYNTNDPATAYKDNVHKAK